MISEAVLNQLVHANWKERLAGIEALTEVKFTNYRVCTGLGISLCHFPGLECHEKRLLVLESSGNLSNSSKKY